MIRWWLVCALLCGAARSHFAIAQTGQHLVDVPNVAECREGDLWNAYDPTESQRLHALVYQPLV